MRRNEGGFTIIELIVVAAIITILATILTYSMARLRQRAKLTRVSAELTDISKAVSQYAQDNNYQYPADAARGAMPGLEKYLAGGTWPTSIWPHGLFDWDSWISGGGQQVYQISYRLCSLTDPIAYCSDPILFPHFTRNSSIYYCVSDATGGSCSPHQDYPTDPGYCVNCRTHEVNPPL